MYIKYHSIKRAITSASLNQLPSTKLAKTYNHCIDIAINKFLIIFKIKSSRPACTGTAEKGARGAIASPHFFQYSFLCKVQECKNPLWQILTFNKYGCLTVLYVSLMFNFHF